MVALKIDTGYSTYSRGGHTLEQCREYIFGTSHIPKPYNTYVGIPMYRYQFKNGDMFQLPFLEDSFCNVADYRVDYLEFIAPRRSAIFGPRYI